LTDLIQTLDQTMTDLASFFGVLPIVVLLLDGK